MLYFFTISTHDYSSRSILSAMMYLKANKRIKPANLAKSSFVRIGKTPSSASTQKLRSSFIRIGRENRPTDLGGLSRDMIRLIDASRDYGAAMRLDDDLGQQNPVFEVDEVDTL